MVCGQPSWSKPTPGPDAAAGAPLLELVDVTGDTATPARPAPPLLPVSGLVADLRGELIRRAALRRAGKWIGGMRTGFRLIDKAMLGLSPGRVSVLSANTGSGKSTLSNQVAFQTAAFAGQDACAVYVSFENSPFQLALKLLSRLSGIVISHLETGTFEEDDRKFLAALELLGAVPLYYVEGSSRVTPEVMAERIQQAREDSRRTNCLLVLDYLHMAARYAPGNGNTEKVGWMVARMMELAKAEKAHVWAIGSQNRKANESSTATLHGGKDASEIEYDADHLLVLTGKGKEPTRRLELLKNRHGEADVYQDFTFTKSIGFFSQGDDDDRWREE